MKKLVVAILIVLCLAGQAIAEDTFFNDSYWEIGHYGSWDGTKYTAEFSAGIYRLDLDSIGSWNDSYWPFGAVFTYSNSGQNIVAVQVWNGESPIKTDANYLHEEVMLLNFPFKSEINEIGSIKLTSVATFELRNIVFVDQLPAVRSEWRYYPVGSRLQNSSIGSR